MRYLLVVAAFLFGISLAQVRPTAQKTPDEKKSKVYLLHTDELRFNKAQNPDAQLLVGNVHFRHDSVHMFCDSAYFYEQRNSFEAFDNVRLNQGDTLFLYGDWLYYDGNTQLAQMRVLDYDHKVRMIHNETWLETDSLDYDRIDNLGYYFNGGTLYDGDNILSSEWGEYSPATKWATFNYDVELLNPQFRLRADTLRYHSETKMAHLVGPTYIDSTDGESHIYSETGTYHTETDRANLYERSYYYSSDGRHVTGDTLFYDKQNGIGEAFGNVIYTDTINKNRLTGDYCFYNDPEGYAFATKRAVAMDFSQGDTLYLHGDTLKMVTYAIDTDSIYRKAFAYHKVRVFRTDVQAVCDSLVFNSQDSCLTLYDNPIVWNEGQQLFGEEIRVYMKENTIDWAHIIGQATSIEQIDSTNFNQVTGKEMKAYFINGEIYQTDVISNVQAVYYTIDDKDSTIIGVNNLETSLLNLYMENRKVSKIKASTQTTGTMYPLSLLPPDKKYLTIFNWFDYIRPTDKDDIFLWRAKKSDQILKPSVRRKAPLPKLSGRKEEEE